MTTSPHCERPITGLGSGRAYYLCQLLGWSAYGTVIYIMSAQRDPTRALTGTVLWCGVGLAGTHLLRSYSRRYPWETVPQLLPRLVCVILLLPVAMIGAGLAAGAFLPASVAPREVGGWIAVAHFFQAMLVVALWCALYFSALEMRRRRAAETEALRLALVAQAAQFYNLRSQLNPHFLFNCLNSLCELIDEDPKRAKQVVLQLSDLLRYTLRADRVETVSLEEELRAVEDYLSLEKVRLEGRLRLRYEVSPEALPSKVPPMLVQTLAENAVKHGIAKQPSGGELTIAARRAEGKLQILVTNTGSLAGATDSTAVGLENARERLRLVYGEGASLTLRAESREKVQAAVTIPFRPVPRTA